MIVIFFQMSSTNKLLLDILSFDSQFNQKILYFLILDPTPESQETESLLAAARSGETANDVDLAGKRLVSENEWQMLQLEVRFFLVYSLFSHLSRDD